MGAAQIGLSPRPLQAHCDTLGGPVIKAAQKALEAGNINLVLIWVQKADEPEIRQAFEKTLAVRKLGREARDLADMYFFETLVRLHRAGEGAPYIGLKPAGTDIGPVIPAVDKAVEDGSDGALLKLLAETVQQNVEKHFHEILETRKFSPDDVEAGRRFVKTYVIFTHYVERIYDSALKPADGHVEAAPAPAHEHSSR
ncbi:MAG: hypothetical protein A2W03_07755 [Candidatus Aminicenantes bacterium RBG_16_63_16]|nr:MAG: hypothetical protein A2W03_07755 [Candidatus Aminicenantes bacterium RBG_16_63_16]